MVIAFVAFGMIFGAAAATYTVLAGGSILLALAAYSAAGTLAALGVVGVLLVINERHSETQEWTDAKERNNPVSA